jgi:hypothetical protein
MSIDRAGGQYWLKPVNTGQLKILWSVYSIFLVILMLQVAIIG